MSIRFREPFERLSNINEVKVVSVIQVKSLVGEGDGIGSPKRQIAEYYSTDGELLARRDSYLDGELKNGIWSMEATDNGSGTPQRRNTAASVSYDQTSPTERTE